MKLNRKILAYSVLILMLLVFLPSISRGATNYFNPTKFVVTRGTLIAGNLTDLQVGNPGIMSIRESNQANPLSVRFDFSGLQASPTVININLYSKYQGSSSHWLTVSVYNFSSSKWVQYGTVYNSPSFAWLNITMKNALSNFVSSGNFSLQISHVQNGISSHYYYIDTLVLSTEWCSNPTFSQIEVSSLVASSTCVFSASVIDESGLSGYIFSTNNTGVWKNDTWTSFVTNPSWANVTKTLNNTVDNVVGYLWYANCTANQWGITSIGWITTQEFMLSVQTTTHSWTIVPGENNRLIDEAAIVIVVTASRTYKIQVKGNGPFTCNSYSISLGSVKCHKDTLSSAIQLTTNYQDVPTLTGLPAGTNVESTFRLWLSCPFGTQAGEYNYTLSIQVAQSS
jgi:hypothetical protein